MAGLPDFHPLPGKYVKITDLNELSPDLGIPGLAPWRGIGRVSPVIIYLTNPTTRRRIEVRFEP